MLETAKKMYKCVVLDVNTFNPNIWQNEKNSILRNYTTVCTKNQKC